MTPETKAFLDEARSPSLCCPEKRDSLLLAMGELSEEIDAQARRYARLLRALEMTEEIEPITSMVEEAYQSCRGMQKDVGEIERALRRLVKTQAHFRVTVARMTAEAEKAEVAPDAMAPDSPEGSVHT